MNTSIPRPRVIALTLIVTLLALTLAGCMIGHQHQRHEANSVVQFLYPGQDMPYITPQIPTLRLPLRVGIAFVPPPAGPGRYVNSVNSVIAESQKSELLHGIADQFKTLPFVQSIDIVPATYLRPGGGFQNLDQLRALMGIDVICLVAFDQSQNTSDTAWSFAYWTIIGAYVVPAQKNDTHTLMEAVVYDITSRSLLFRAPGVSSIDGHSTPIRSAAQLRADAERSLANATADLTMNLRRELDLFKVRAKEEPQNIRIEHKPGYTGAGDLSGWLTGLILALLGLLRLRCTR